MLRWVAGKGVEASRKPVQAVVAQQLYTVQVRDQQQPQDALQPTLQLWAHLKPGNERLRNVPLRAQGIYSRTASRTAHRGAVQMQCLRVASVPVSELQRQSRCLTLRGKTRKRSAASNISSTPSGSFRINQPGSRPH